MTLIAQHAKTLTALLVFALLATGCTKKRDATLPEDSQETIFAISEFGELQGENSSLKITTNEELSPLSLGESSKATAEKGIVAVSKVDVPQRLQFMFKGLEMTGQTHRTYPITFSVDKQFVTAYKIITNTSELSILERHLAQSKEELLLQQQLHKNNDNSKIKTLMTSLKNARTQKMQNLNHKNIPIFVPLFKFKISKYGVLQRTKNELKEETSTLRLSSTDWENATHIEISPKSADRLPVGLEPSSRGELDRTYVMDQVNNKVMTAGLLKNEFQIPINTQDESLTLTLLDVDALHIFEIGQMEKLNLSDSQQQQLKSGSAQSNVRHCSADIKKVLPPSLQTNCVLILRYDIPISYVRPELSTIDYDGNQNATLTFKPIRAKEQIGLVQIEKNVQPKKVEGNSELDPRTTIRIADIQGKEFFFRRTLQDAPANSVMTPGFAGSLVIVKFELAENRLVIRKADRAIEYKSGSNETDFEELMSLPVKYLKKTVSDASGAKYSLPRLAPATRTDADFIELDWTKNTLSARSSPYETIENSCIHSVGNSEVSDVEMKLDQGLLNFSVNYSVGLSYACMTTVETANDYSIDFNYQATARLKERVSFKLNDGKTDKAFAASIPFKVQNTLGYGVFTLGKMAPTEQGLLGREGQEINYPVIQDFRNGRILVYTVTGLEPTVDISPELRQLYKDAAREVINSWDLAYRQAFKGSHLERVGRYLQIQFSGEDGVSATLGDLDKNIIHFENKFNDNSPLGVSQAGVNPRSGIVIADSLTVYAGNHQTSIARTQRTLKNKQAWMEKKKTFRENGLAQLAQKEESLKKTEDPPANLEEGAQKATQFMDNLITLTTQNQTLSPLKVDSYAMTASAKNISRGLIPDEKREYRKKLGSTLPHLQNDWFDRVFKVMSEKGTLDEMEIQGLVAKEMLASEQNQLSPLQRAKLKKIAGLSEIRRQLNKKFENGYGCLLQSPETIAHQFTNRPVAEALRQELISTLAHEVGHSQGLTHNFFGSFDKTNFDNENGSYSKRNYSSVMDYIQPQTFLWAGLGTYDIHAIRASQLGLLEASSSYISELKMNNSASQALVNGKYLSIQSIQASLAPQGWNNFSKEQVKGMLKPYLYCTDRDVGYEPTCQRHDYGTNAKEIVENLIKDYDDFYIENYHSWDRNDFGFAFASQTLSSTFRRMFTMRQFLDEFFHKTFNENVDLKEIDSYGEAAHKTFIFFNQLIRTADTDKAFQDPDRFLTVPYTYPELDKEKKMTGNTLKGVELVERRALKDLAISPDRLDTIGIEYSKLMAMNLLTLAGYPAFKYRKQRIDYSYLDYEKFFLNGNSENSVYINTLIDLMLNQLQAVFTNENVVLQLIPGETLTITPRMKLNASISSVLDLETRAFSERDNYANLFKVGSSFGNNIPTDRVNLSLLGVPEHSNTRLNFWAADNASAVNKLFKAAASKYFYLQRDADLSPIIERLILAQLREVESPNLYKEEIQKEKDNLIAQLNFFNSQGDIVSKEQVEMDPTKSIDNQVTNMVEINRQLISVALKFMREQKSDSVDVLIEKAKEAADLFPLVAYGQKKLVSTLKTYSKELGDHKGFEVYQSLPSSLTQLVSGRDLEGSYQRLMQQIEFLHTLTTITNPEYGGR